MSQIELDQNHQVLIVRPSVMPSDEDFALWASIFLHHEAISLQQIEQGADRHLQRFSFQGEGFDLHFEHYSNSVWINGEGAFAEHLLPELMNCLSN